MHREHGSRSDELRQTSHERDALLAKLEQITKENKILRSQLEQGTKEKSPSDRKTEFPRIPSSNRGQ